MSIIDTLTKGIEQFEEVITDGVDTVAAAVKGGRQHDMRTTVAERQEAEQRQRDRQQAALMAEYERVQAWLAQPRRATDAVQAAIQTAQDEHSVYTSQLADLLQRISQDDDAVSPKTVNQHSQLTLSIQAVQGRLQRLEAERLECEKVDRLNEAQARIADYVDLAEKLQTLESGEFAEIEKRYNELMQQRRQMRHQLTAWQHAGYLIATGKSGDLATTNAIRADVDALQAPHRQQINTIWKEV